jgi:flavoprotein hydroxylase
VREQVRAPLSDLGFSYDWLLCDIALRQPREFRPTNIQLCDPERPTTMVGSGPGRRRFEFMRMPGESTEWLNRSGTAWRLLSRFDITPATAKLLRHATYTFRSSWVTRWRTGRIMLAGDASHLMPPFTGQGMCTGLQDVANLAWKLDLVLRGVVATDLLDSYGEERSEQAEGAVRASVQLGKVICVDDPKAARDRDVAMLARARQAGTSGPQPAAALTTGLLHRADDGKVAAGAGEVFPQARVTFRERSDLLDEICRTGANRPGVPGFLLLTTDTEGQRLDHTDLDDEARALLHILETTFVTVITSGTPGVGALVDDVVRVGDLDDVYLRYLSSSGSRAVLVRPDHHVFGTASTPEGLSALVRQLGHDLALPRLSVA